jgi:site-specific DNA recombinase
MTYGPGNAGHLHHPQLWSFSVAILTGSLQATTGAHSGGRSEQNLIEHVSIGPAENGIEIEIVGEIAKMIEFSIGKKAKQPILDENRSRSVKVVAGAGFEPATFRL